MIRTFFCIFLFGALAAIEIEISGQVLDVEIAKTPEKQTKGLSGRTHLPDGTGMLFIYKRPQIVRFWMKDTLIPLSIGFFDAERTLVDWKEMEVPSKEKKTLPTYSSHQPVCYALEVPAGWFTQHKIELGAKFKLFKNPSQDPIDTVQ